MSQSSQNPDPISQLIQLLRQQSMDIDAELVADLLWLAPKIDRTDWTSSPEAEPSPVTLPDENLQNSVVADEMPTVPPPIQPRPDPVLQADLTPAVPDSGTAAASSNIAVDTPAAPALRQSLALGRSLRPLMLTVPSRSEHILDEEATANYMAEQNICVPILQPAPERWLRLALVVEESRATVIWRQTLRDFQTLLERQGAFRDVRLWSLHSRADGVLQLRANSNPKGDRSRPRSPKELLDPTGRCLVLLVSDCTSAAWQRGTLQSLLQIWMQDNLVTLVQLLPERLWERSVLGEGIPVPLGAHQRGEKNARFQIRGPAPLSLITATAALKLPVVTLDPEPLYQWARAIAGSAQAQTPGIVLDLPTPDDDLYGDGADTENDWGTGRSPNPERVVKQFENTASPDAKRLAGLLAAVPVTLPIIHLVQETMLPHTRQSHVAEVLMSGLLRDLGSGLEPAGTSASASHYSEPQYSDPRYEFVEGVRDRLIAPQFVSVAEVDQVLETVSHYIARRVGLSIRSFTAFLMLRSDEPGFAHPDVAEFARISKHTLRRLGSDYAALVDTIEQRMMPDVMPDVMPDLEAAPPDDSDRPTVDLDSPDLPSAMAEATAGAAVDEDWEPPSDQDGGSSGSGDRHDRLPFQDFTYVTPLLRVEQDIGLPLDMKTVEVATFATEFRSLESAVDRIQPMTDEVARRRHAEALAASLSPPSKLADRTDATATAAPSVSPAAVISPRDIESLFGLSPSTQYNHGIVLMRSEIAEFVRDCGYSINPDDIDHLFGTVAYGQFFGRDLSRMVYGDAQSTTAPIYTYAEVLVRLDLPPITLPMRLRSLLSELQIAFPYRQTTAQNSTDQLQEFPIRIATLERSRNWRLQTRWQVSYRSGLALKFVEPLPAEVSLEMIAIPKGSLQMGSPPHELGRSESEDPLHEVTLAGFFMGRYPITQDQWRVVASMPPEQRHLEPYPARFRGGDRPIERVSWHDAVEFCDRISRYTGRPYRLPSEAEWEYACRAHTSSPFHFGDMITTDVANYNGSAYGSGRGGRRRGETTPVGAFNCANGFGLSDMHGNVREWCLDHWHDTYDHAPTDGYPWQSDNTNGRRVLRSGSWLDFPQLCRSANRSPFLPDTCNYCIGFRVVMGDRPSQ